MQKEQKEDFGEEIGLNFFEEELQKKMEGFLLTLVKKF